MLICHRHRASVSGRKFFHSRCISWSYRNRGYEARTHRNPADRSSTFVASTMGNSSCGGLRRLGLKNRMAVSVFISIMLAYSARKNKAKGPAAYSTLNPETSSDSPSVRSKGARFVSARVETYHIMASGQHGKMRYRGSWVTARVPRV